MDILHPVTPLVDLGAGLRLHVQRANMLEFVNALWRSVRRRACRLCLWFTITVWWQHFVHRGKKSSRKNF